MKLFLESYKSVKRILLIISVFFVFSANAQIEKIIPARPSPAKLVNDFTNSLTAEQKIALENKLVAYDDSTSNQIAVVVINSTNDYPIEDVALRILRDWGVGNKKTNNGIVLLVAKDDRNVRIEVGYGLEGAIPDITSGQIIDREILPNFKAGNFYRGLDEATSAIFLAAAGEYTAPEGYGKKKNKISLGRIIMIILFIIWVIYSSSGGGSGGMLSRRGYRGWIGPTFSGGGWSGGSSGGGFGGGGFGGFGGGGGGGGGASGSW